VSISLDVTSLLGRYDLEISNFTSGPLGRHVLEIRGSLVYIESDFKTLVSHLV